jgi:phosphoglycerate dehydrogenase-like enzyme
MAEPKIATMGHRFPDAAVEHDALLGRGVDVVNLGGLDKESALAAAVDAEAVLLGVSFSLDADAIARLPACRVIVRYGIGLDNVDIEAAERSGILVRNVPDYGVEEVANHALALLLAMARRLDVLGRRARSGQWAGAIAGLQLKRLSDSTLVVVGAGRIGSALVERAVPIWGDVVVVDPYLTSSDDLPSGVSLVGDLDEALARADFVSIHVPATTDTRGLFSAERFAAMKAGVVLVNCSRGDVLDEDALAAALASGHVAAAGLDVFVGEPEPRPDLLEANDVWPTPHAAWFSTSSLVDLRRKAALAAAESLTTRTEDLHG